MSGIAAAVAGTAAAASAAAGGAAAAGGLAAAGGTAASALAKGGKMAGKMMGRGGGGGLLESLKGLKGKLNATPVNAGLAGVGLVKTMIGKSKQKKGDAMLPQNEDPEIRSMQRHFARRKRAFQTGTASNAQRQGIKSFAQGGRRASFRLGGGTKGLNMMTQMFNQGIQGLNQQNLAGELEFSKLDMGLTKDMSQKKTDLAMHRSDTALARAAQTEKEGKSSMNLGIARAIPTGEVNQDVISQDDTGIGGVYSDIKERRRKAKEAKDAESLDETTE
jgi:hypothetical protein